MADSLADLSPTVEQVGDPHKRLAQDSPTALADSLADLESTPNLIVEVTALEENAPGIFCLS